MIREIDDVVICHVSTPTSEDTTDNVIQMDDPSDDATATENRFSKTILRKPKSGRWWKSIRKERYYSLYF